MGVRVSVFSAYSSTDAEYAALYSENGKAGLRVFYSLLWLSSFFGLCA